MLGLRPKIVEVTLSLDTNIYAANDLLADTQVVSNAFYDIDKPGVLDSVYVIDEDDQTAVPIVLYLLSDSGSLGTENSALNPTDAVARTILGTVPILAADFKDLINSKAATIKNIGLIVKPKTGTRDLYIAAALDGAGTPTYTASGIKVRLGIRS